MSRACEEEDGDWVTGAGEEEEVDLVSGVCAEETGDWVSMADEEDNGGAGEGEDGATARDVGDGDEEGEAAAGLGGDGEAEGDAEAGMSSGVCKSHSMLICGTTSLLQSHAWHQLF